MSPPPKPVQHPPDPEAEQALAAVLERDPYLCLADQGLRLVSVFDDLRYDRADMDMLNGPMRSRLVTALAALGIRQATGSRLDSPTTGLRLHMPKFRALGASPFDALRDTAREPKDYAVLTPTQAACAIIEAHATDDAVRLLERLVQTHPVNLLRIFDYLDRSPAHEAFRPAIGHLVPIQRAAIRSSPLKDRRALR
ncbi:hypothetical protein [Ponticoccus alexandrii]|nr:hypothetical protein [Ponticoccus alexandrii]